MRDVLRRDEVPSGGVSRERLRAQLAADRWRALGPLLIIRHNGPLTPEQQLWAAALHCGPRAALAGLTAAAVWGLKGWADEQVHVLVPRGTTVPRLPGVPLKVHESRRFLPEHVHPAAEPPRTRPARSVMDAAVWMRSTRSACGLVAAAVQQRITTAQAVLDELDAAGAVRHRTLLRAALHDIAGGAQALSEIDFGRLCRRHGLPEPLRQQVRRDSHGRRRYLDATLRAPDGRLVRVEVDGAIHLAVATYWDDMARGNELAIDGEQVLRFPSVALRLDEAAVVDQLRRALYGPPPAHRRVVRA